MEETPTSAIKTVEPGDSPPETPADAAGHRRALLIVFLVVFIDLLGFGIVLPLLPQLVDQFLKGTVTPQAEGAVVGLVYCVFSLMQFLFAPIWGRISDRVGRRPILLIGLAGSVVFYALFGYGAGLSDPNWRIVGLVVMFVARLGAGIAGATIATAQAVIADSTTPERRSRGMALIGAAFGIGFTFGPLIGAASLKRWPEALGAPAFAAAVLSLVALGLGIWLLPETLKTHSTSVHRRWLDWRGLQRALQTPAIGILIVSFFMATFAFANFESTLALLIRDTLHYSSDDIYFMFAYIGFMLMVAQGGFYQVLSRRGVGELAFLTSGVVLLMVGMVGLAAVAVLGSGDYGLGQSGLLAAVLVALAIAVFGFAFLTPSVQALISRRSDPNQQGEILGVNQSASALARILGPLIGLSAYTWEPTHVLPYVVATVLLALVLAMTPRLK